MRRRDLMYSLSISDSDIVSEESSGLMSSDMLRKLNEVYAFFKLFSNIDDKTYGIKNRIPELIADENDKVVTCSCAYTNMYTDLIDTWDEL